jgi:hypothetical protein
MGHKGGFSSRRVISSAPYILEQKHKFKPLQVILSAGDIKKSMDPYKAIDALHWSLALT